MGSQDIMACLFKKNEAVVKAEPVEDNGEKHVKTEENRDAGACSRDERASDSSRTSAWSRDKAKYNAFSYRLRSSPDVIRERYAALKDSKDTDAINAFVDEIIDMRGKYDEDSLKRFRTVRESDTQHDRSTCVSWKEAVTKYFDEDVLMELLSCGSIESRKNPALPKGSNVPWPRNQEIYYTRSAHDKKRKTTDEQ